MVPSYVPLDIVQEPPSETLLHHNVNQYIVCEIGGVYPDSRSNICRVLKIKGHDLAFPVTHEGMMKGELRDDDAGRTLPRPRGCSSDGNVSGVDVASRIIAQRPITPAEARRKPIGQIYLCHERAARLQKWSPTRANSVPAVDCDGAGYWLEQQRRI